MNLFLADEGKTIDFAKKLAKRTSSPILLGFQGPIGSGKTTLIRAFLKALGITETIKSPSFSLIESYELPAFAIHHIDLYRIEDKNELEYLGIRELFSEPAVILIEWPERAGHQCLPIDLLFKFCQENEGRRLEMTAMTKSGFSLLSQLGLQHEN